MKKKKKMKRRKKRDRGGERKKKRKRRGNPHSQKNKTNKINLIRQPQIGVAKLYLHLSVPTSLKQTGAHETGVTNLTLTIEPFEDGEKLHDEIVTIMGEVRQVQIIHTE